MTGSSLLTGRVRGALLGVAVGDALGVPHEFRPREVFTRAPVTDMTGYGTHGQPAGTWSDDAALSFCLAEAIAAGTTETRAVARLFLRWYREGYWSARGTVFDVGITTAEALRAFERGVEPGAYGADDERTNGNGALMRILPLLFVSDGMEAGACFALTRRIAGITHGHVRSALACHLYLDVARQLLAGRDARAACRVMQEEAAPFIAAQGLETEAAHFERVLADDIASMPSAAIHSSGYVVHTLEAALWCLCTTSSYRDAVLAAVNLGDDTDTTAAVAGGLAGLLYGADAIPSSWLDVLARRKDVEELCVRMCGRLELGTRG